MDRGPFQLQDEVGTATNTASQPEGTSVIAVVLYFGYARERKRKPEGTATGISYNKRNGTWDWPFSGMFCEE
jgi:hypothetical protein